MAPVPCGPQRRTRARSLFSLLESTTGCVREGPSCMATCGCFLGHIKATYACFCSRGM